MSSELRLPHMVEGFVYILKNPAMKGLVKIGMTTRDPEQRAKEISDGTGVPVPFEVYYMVRVSDCRAVERKLHIALDDFRENTRREFFRMSLGQAKRRVKGAAALHRLGDTMTKPIAKIVTLSVPVLLCAFLVLSGWGAWYLQGLWQSVSSGEIFSVFHHPEDDIFYSPHYVVLYGPVFLCLIIVTCVFLRPSKRDKRWRQIRKKKTQSSKKVRGR